MPAQILSKNSHGLTDIRTNKPITVWVNCEPVPPSVFNSSTLGPAATQLPGGALHPAIMASQLPSPTSSGVTAPQSVEQITSLAQDYQYSPQVPLRSWLRTAASLIKEVGPPLPLMTRASRFSSIG